MNEYSTRYSEAIDSAAVTADVMWRQQATANKQGSAGYVNVWPDDWQFADNTVTGPDGYSLSSIYDVSTPGKFLSYEEAELQRRSRDVYERRLSLGVAREQARKDLPLSTYTEAYWKIDLHNLLHFLGLRMDLHAQQEIRDYANVIGENIVAKLFPLTWEAFLDYRLNSKSLSRPVQDIIFQLAGSGKVPAKFSDLLPLLPEEWKPGRRSRERDECISLLQSLAILDVFSEANPFV